MSAVPPAPVSHSIIISCVVTFGWAAGPFGPAGKVTTMCAPGGNCALMVLVSAVARAPMLGNGRDAMTGDRSISAGANPLQVRRNLFCVAVNSVANAAWNMALVEEDMAKPEIELPVPASATALRWSVIVISPE